MPRGEIQLKKSNQTPKNDIFGRIGDFSVRAVQSIYNNCKFVYRVFRAMYYVLRGHGDMRRVDLWVEIDAAGLRAIPIVCLISFMIGLIIAFVGHMQLEMFGAEIYVAALVAISMVRIVGAIMTGIIMAGRTGASYAAEIGSMRANDEIDAIQTMGISPMEFLVLPRVIALTITMPLLTIIADAVAILGGMCVAILIMNVSIAEYWQTTLDWISFNNFAVGVFHGWVFGWVIAITGCICGLRAERNAAGIGRATTRAVVMAIVGCIVATAILTIVFNWLGI